MILVHVFIETANRFNFNNKRFSLITLFKDMHIKDKTIYMTRNFRFILIFHQKKKLFCKFY